MTIRKFKNEKELKDHMKDHSGSHYIIDFWASWCGPCKKIAPDFESLSNDERFSKIYFVKIDIEDDHFEKLVKNLDVKSLPTFIVLTCNIDSNGEDRFNIISKNTGSDRSKIEHMLHYSLSKL